MWSEDIKYFYPEISTSFLKQLDIQLNNEFKQLTGYNIPLKKISLRSEEAVKNDIQTMTSSFRALVIIVVAGIGGKIAWKNLKGDTFIKVSDEVTEEDIQFWWEELDIEYAKEALSAYAEPVKFPFSIKKKRFKIIYYQTFESEMIFTLPFSEQETTKKELEEGVNKIIEEWNQSPIAIKEDDRMWIEHFVDAKLESPNEIRFFFEFHHAIIEGLEFVVKKLNESSLPIKTLKIEPT
ncbi:hypothetical protein [Runella zeae]|uniref:hypothetical protein n=1 Tax=Runella zeae TaxID=94255 RepID=UPI0023550D0C|nr:hypothetical protein [Runella zeae]